MTKGEGDLDLESQLREFHIQTDLEYGQWKRYSVFVCLGLFLLGLIHTYMQANAAIQIIHLLLLEQGPPEGCDNQGSHLKYILMFWKDQQQECIEYWTQLKQSESGWANPWTVAWDYILTTLFNPMKHILHMYNQLSYLLQYSVLLAVACCVIAYFVVMTYSIPLISVMPKERKRKEEPQLLLL